MGSAGSARTATANVPNTALAIASCNVAIEAKEGTVVILTSPQLLIIDQEIDKLCSCLAGPPTVWRRAIIYDALKRTVKAAVLNAR